MLVSKCGTTSLGARLVGVVARGLQKKSKARQNVTSAQRERRRLVRSEDQSLSWDVTVATSHVTVHLNCARLRVPESTVTPMSRFHSGPS